MLERNILIIDDNSRIADLYIPAYELSINKAKQVDTKWEQYSFNFFHKQSLRDALQFLEDQRNAVDVLVVDYDFNGEPTFSNGTAFVKYVRDNLNRYCQIVFYTMQGIGSIEKQELVDLINSDVFQLVDKSDTNIDLGTIIFNAATQCNPVVESLERFFLKYKSMLANYSYTFGGETISLEDIIMHIRMDDDIGRMFLDRLLQKGILLNINI